MAEEQRKQKVRRRLSACPALSPLCSGGAVCRGLQAEEQAAQLKAFTELEEQRELQVRTPPTRRVLL